MFDWARGSSLIQFIDAGIPYADWDPIQARHLKNWSIPWFLGAVEFRRGLQVLDVGSGTPRLLQYLATNFGCEVHALDVREADVGLPEFGLPEDVHRLYPDVHAHVGMAGHDLLPAESFDIVYCNSVIEHTYDTKEALDPVRPLDHINILRDLIRMLKPGGLLLMNWDTYLDGVPHHLGWDYEADLWLLRHCGMRLADPRRRVRPAQYIYGHSDTLFFAVESVIPFAATTLPHAVSINTIWIKPGDELRTGILPRANLLAAYLPTEETDHSIQPLRDSGMSTAQIDARFREQITQMQRACAGRLDL
jgi:SAM-dependent methyltransferase